MATLAVDIGNSNVHAGIFATGKILRALSVPHRQSAKISRRRLAAEVDAIVYSSVQPTAERAITRHLRKTFGIAPLKIGRDILIPLRSRYSPPEAAGTDRLANGVAAFYRLVSLRKRGYAAVIDIGTAITVDVVSARGEFLGGVIAPGMEKSAKALADFCSLLPKVRIGKTDRTIGRSTADNIRAGIYWGTVGLIERVASNLRGELGSRPYIIATGGDARLFERRNLFDEIDPTITLEGIALCYETTCRRR